MFVSDLFLYPAIFQVGSSGIYPVYNRWDWKNMPLFGLIPIIFFTNYKYLKLALPFVFANYNVELHCVVWYGLWIPQLAMPLCPFDSNTIFFECLWATVFCGYCTLYYILKSFSILLTCTLNKSPKWNNIISQQDV